MKTSTLATDNQLVKAFQDGNNAALETLVNRHKDKIFTSINFLVKDTFLAEDIFQETFIKIIGALRANRYNDEGKFLPWATRIAHSLCMDHFRKTKRTPTITMGDGSDLFDFLNVQSDNADNSITKSQSHTGVQELLLMLPEDQREVVVLRHYADLSFKEIAEKTGCSINTALGRMRYGLLNMRKMMTEKQIAL